MNQPESEDLIGVSTSGLEPTDARKSAPSPIAIVALTISAIAIGLSAITVYFGFGPWQQFNNTEPAADGYVPPRSIATLVETVQTSTVTVYCDLGDEYFSGSGWAMAIDTDRADEFPTAIVTNHHVIEACLGGKGTLTVKQYGGEEFLAVIDNWDAENDLAVIATKLLLESLPLSQNPPAPGYWVMAVGSPQEYEGSVAFGNVVNVSTDNEIFITASISGGNSGGPLIDNEGYVIGTNTWRGLKAIEYNGAKSLDAMCGGIMKCDGDSYWDWD
jgi:S1-C subfamily serine protease